MTRVRSLCRLELTGETARSSLSAIADVGPKWRDDASSRVLRCETRGDPREAAWLAKKGGASSRKPGMFQRRDKRIGSDADGMRRSPRHRARARRSPPRGSKKLSLRDYTKTKLRTIPIPSPGVPSSSSVARAGRSRRPHPGFTIIAPRGWAQPLLLALVHLGARAAGRVEWGWLATQAGTSRFPEDFPDTDAGKRCFAAVEDRNAARADVVPRGKRTPEPVVRRREPRRAPDLSGKFPAKGSEGSGTRQKRGKSRWRPVRDGAPFISSSSSSSSSFVRCVVRCPWGGRARVGTRCWTRRGIWNPRGVRASAGTGATSATGSPRSGRRSASSRPRRPRRVRRRGVRARERRRAPDRSLARVLARDGFGEE